MSGIIAILSCLLAVGGAEDHTDLVRPQLLADVATVRPGQTFRVGLLLAMKPEWHVYWKNPGDSGLATQIRLHVPQGFAVSPLRWPVPAVFRQPGDLVGYGYSDTVLLWADVTAPQALQAGSQVTLELDTEWLSCQQVCVPGSAKLTLTVPVAQTSQPANGPVFALWDQRLPIEGDAAQRVVVPRIQGALAPGGQGGFTIDLDWKVPVTGVEWIPATPETLALEDLAVVNQGQHTRIAFKARTLRGQRPSNEPLESVVAYTDQAGQRRGVLLRVPLAPLNQNH